MLEKVRTVRPKSGYLSFFETQHPLSLEAQYFPAERGSGYAQVFANAKLPDANDIKQSQQGLTFDQMRVNDPSVGYHALDKTNAASMPVERSVSSQVVEMLFEAGKTASKIAAVFSAGKGPDLSHSARDASATTVGYFKAFGQQLQDKFESSNVQSTPSFSMFAAPAA